MRQKWWIKWEIDLYYVTRNFVFYAGHIILQVIYIIKDGADVDTRTLIKKSLGNVGFGRPRTNWKPAQR
jgi:hypothetical protein